MSSETDVVLDLAAEIQRLKENDVSYLLLTDKEIEAEILAKERTNQPRPNHKPVNQDDSVLVAVPTLVVPSIVPADTAELIQQELAFWQELGIKADLGKIRIPPRKEGFNWLISMLPGITPQKAYDICQSLFDCWKWTDQSLDVVVTENDRDPANGPYAIWVKDTIEANPNLKNKSANDLKEKGIPGITLAERLILGAKYYKYYRLNQPKKLSQKHLDLKNWTLCAGSRSSFGSVPGVGWDSGGGELRVGWCSPGYAGDDLRSREVVS